MLLPRLACTGTGYMITAKVSNSEGMQTEESIRLWPKLITLTVASTSHTPLKIKMDGEYVYLLLFSANCNIALLSKWCQNVLGAG